MATELKSKEVVKNHKGKEIFVTITGIVDGRFLRTSTENVGITDNEAKALLEAMVGE